MRNGNGYNEILTMAKKQASEYLVTQNGPNGIFSLETLPPEFMHVVPDLKTAAEIVSPHKLSFWDIDGVLIPQGWAMARSLISVLGVKLMSLLDIEGLKKIGQMEPDALKVIVSKSSPRLPRQPILQQIFKDIAGIEQGAYGFHRGRLGSDEQPFQDLVNRVTNSLKTVPTDFAHIFDGPNLMTKIDKPQEGTFVGQIQNALVANLGSNLIPHMVMISPRVHVPSTVDFTAMNLRPV